MTARRRRILRTLLDPEDCAAIVSRLDRLTPAARRRWGRMTVHQMVCHLSDGYRVPLGDRPVPARGSIFDRTAVRWFGLHTPIPWPRGFRTLPETDQEKGGTRPLDFAADLGAVRALIRRVAGAGPALSGRVHPIFGPLTEWEWGRWAYRHADHHLTQFGA